MKIAIAQLNPTIGDLTGNAALILTAANQASALGFRLLLTPELSLCGYPPRDLLLQPSFIEAMEVTLQQLARDLPKNLAVLVGTVKPNPQAGIEGGKPLFNSAALLENQQIRQFFYKRLLPTYDVFDEDRYFEPGQESSFFTLDEPGEELENLVKSESRSPMKIGVTICEDLWNNVDFWGKRSYRADPLADLAKQNVDLIVNISASPYTVGKQQVREAMLRNSTRHYHQPIIYVNQVGGNDDLIFDGNSFACDRTGQIVGRAKAFESDFISLEYAENRQNLIPSLINSLPESADAEIWAALVLGVRDYVGKCRFQKVVIGLSGGVDSALVAAIATVAIGAENVLGVLNAITL